MIFMYACNLLIDVFIIYYGVIPLEKASLQKKRVCLMLQSEHSEN